MSLVIETGRQIEDEMLDAAPDGGDAHAASARILDDASKQGRRRSSPKRLRTRVGASALVLVRRVGRGPARRRRASGPGPLRRRDAGTAARRVVGEVVEEEVVPEALLAPAGKENAGLGPRAVTMETGAPVVLPNEGADERTVTLDQRADRSLVGRGPPPVTPVTQDDGAAAGRAELVSSGGG